MHDEMKAMIAVERKNKRELKELRDLRTKITKLKNPDPKTLAMIDAEINNYLKGDLIK